MGGRHGLSAHVDPGGLRLRSHACRVRAPDRAASRCRRLGRARTRVSGRGIEVITSAAVHQLEALQPGVRVLYRVGDESRTVDVDAAFFAVGWPGNADLVDAAAAGVVTERGYVRVDAFMATSVPHIFAAGDVDGNSMLVSSATLEGRVAAENAVLGRVAGSSMNRPARQFHRPRVRQRRAHRGAGPRPLRLRRRRGPL